MDNESSVQGVEKTLDEIALVALGGLLACGEKPSYDTAHTAYRMAQYMLEVRDQYVS